MKQVLETTSTSARSGPACSSRPLRRDADRLRRRQRAIFGGEAQKVYDEDGLEKFLEHEVENAGRPLTDGPFAKFLRTLAVLQKDPRFEKPPASHRPRDRQEPPRAPFGS